MSDYASSSGLGSVIYPGVQKNLFQRMEQARKSDLNGNSTRTIWARMVSGVQPTDADPKTGTSDFTRPVSIMGGVTDSNGNLKGGFDAIYGRDSIDFGQTIMGDTAVDFTKPLSANEHGERFLPMAGITGISTTTEGELGALRKATINWQCWSLEQLEFYEKFFMKLATTCMIEFGWSVGELDAYTLYDISDFPKAKKSIKDGIETGKRKILDGGGEYEVFSGLISNFNWSVNDAGGFDCETELMSHGEPVIGARTNDSPQTATNNDDIEADDKAAKELETRALNNLNKYLDNIDTEMKIFLGEQGVDIKAARREDVEDGQGINRNIWPEGNKATHMIDIRGWGEGGFGGHYFVTWGWMEDNILSKYMGRASKNYALNYTIRSRDIVSYKNNKPVYESVKVSCHPLMIKAGALDARIATISDNNPLYAQFRKDSDDANSTGFENFVVPDSGQKAGYLRNILINTQTIKSAFKEADNLVGGLEKLFDKINEAFFGIFDFKVSVDYDNPTNIKIIDSNYFKKDPMELLKNPSFHKDEGNGTFSGKYDSIFIFPSMTAENNIVLGQEMESKIPSEGMYAAMAGANKPSDTADPADNKNATAGNCQSDIRSNGIADALLWGFNIPDAFSLSNKFGNSTGLVNNELGESSGPPITENARTALDEDWWEQNYTEDESDPIKNEDGDIIDGDGNIVDVETWNEDTPFTERVSNWFSNKFKAIGLHKDASISNREIMSSWTKAYWTKRLAIGFKGEESGTLAEATLIPLEISFDIDGIAGIFPGNMIHTQFIPKKYRDRVVLVVKSVAHTLSSGGWATKLETMMVAAFNKDKYGTIEAPKKATRADDDIDRIEYKGPIKEDGTVDRDHYTERNGWIGRAVEKYGLYDANYFYNEFGEKAYRLQEAQDTPTREVGDTTKFD